MMHAEHPIEETAAALYSALAVDLKDIEYEQRLPGKTETVKKVRRPTTYDVRVYTFPQMWGSTALGFGGMGGASMTEAYTTVVICTNNDAAIYFAGRYAYSAPANNDCFRADVHKHQMESVSESDIYRK